MSGARIDGRCGSHAGVSEHRRRREAACDACRAWWREYMAAYRSPGSRQAARTRAAALELLAAEQPRRFAELLSQVRAATPRDSR